MRGQRHRRREGEFRAREVRALHHLRGATYADRDAWVRSIGFAGYGEYLASPLWGQVRERVFRAKGNRCFLCGRHATQVHHNRYHKSDLLGLSLKYLNPICGRCHTTIEYGEDGKRSVVGARDQYGRLRGQHLEKARDPNRRRFMRDAVALRIELGRHMGSIGEEVRAPVGGDTPVLPASAPSDPAP
jgi:hypothetical protein